MTFAWNGDTKRNKSMKLNLKTREKHNIRSKFNENKLKEKQQQHDLKSPLVIVSMQFKFLLVNFEMKTIYMCDIFKLIKIKKKYLMYEHVFLFIRLFPLFLSTKFK